MKIRLSNYGKYYFFFLWYDGLSSWKRYSVDVVGKLNLLPTTFIRYIFLITLHPKALNGGMCQKTLIFPFFFAFLRPKNTFYWKIIKNKIVFKFDFLQDSFIKNIHFHWKYRAGGAGEVLEKVITLKSSTILNIYEQRKIKLIKLEQ